MFTSDIIYEGFLKLFGVQVFSQQKQFNNAPPSVDRTKLASGKTAQFPRINKKSVCATG